MVPADPEASGIPIAVFRVALRNRSAPARGRHRLRLTAELRGLRRLADEEGLEERPAVRRGRRQPQRAPPDRRRPGTVPVVAEGEPGRRRLGHARARHAARRDDQPAHGLGRVGLERRSARLLGRLRRRRAARRARRARATTPDGLARGRARPAAGAPRARPLFLLAWHFPNRYSWTPKSDPPAPRGPGRQLLHHALRRRLGRGRDGAAAAAGAGPPHGRVRLRLLRERPARPRSRRPRSSTSRTLRTQTCFRTRRRPLLRLGGLRATRAGCCHGSCTHVWNYEQATPFLFGRSRVAMREVEFVHATDDGGLMSFRVNLPLGARAGVRQGRRRRPDGLHHEAVPRLAALGRRRPAAAALAEGAQGASSSAGSPAAGTPTATA